MFILNADSEYQLPVQLIERYRTSDGPAIKAALWFLLNKGCDVARLASELNIPEEIAERSIRYWCDAGLIREAEDGTSVPVSAPDSEPPKHRGPKSTPKAPITTVIELSEQLLRDPELAMLLQETQAYVGRPLDNSESMKIADLYTDTGLPADVIFLAIAYSKDRAKRGLVNYLSKTVYEWRDEGVMTSEDAERHLQLIEAREKRERQVSSILGTDGALTFRDRKMIASWFEDMGFGIEFVNEAYIRSGNNSVPYINAILKDWFKKGYHSISEIEYSAPANIQPKGRSSTGGSLLKKAVSKKKTDR